MNLSLERHLDVPIDQAWPLVTDPLWMNRWSTAHIEAVAEGDGGGFNSVGAVRRVLLRSAGPRVPLPEVIQRSEPPTPGDTSAGLVYRAFHQPQVRFHRGEIRLSGDGRGGSLLRWDVAFDLVTPGVGRMMMRLLRRDLDASLTRLAALTERPPAVTRPRFQLFAEDLTSLRQRAESCLEDQRRVADELVQNEHPARWFARVYAFVTEAQLRHIDRGGVDHPAWVLRLIPRFDVYWRRNLDAWRAGRPGDAEWHWRDAFRAMERPGSSRRDRQRSLFMGLRGGVVAHIEEDLPRALADVYLDAYEGACDYARFRADYLLMGDVFRTASERLIEEMPPRLLPWWARTFARALPPELYEAVRHHRIYDVPRRRLEAFERGHRLVTWRQGGPQAR